MSYKKRTLLPPNTLLGNPVSTSSSSTPMTGSPDGSTLVPGGSGSLVTPAGTWTFSASTDGGGNNIILLNGSPAGAGAGIELEVANGGNLYANNFQGNWYIWNGSNFSLSSEPIISAPVSNAAIAMPLVQNLQITGGSLGKVPVKGRITAGFATVEANDCGTSLMSTDDVNTVLYLPSGFPRGFICRSYQGGAGQINYVPAYGATLANTASPYSNGPYTAGYFVDIENIGNDEWVVIGNTTPNVLEWSIFGQPQINQGDAVTYSIQYPTLVNSFPGGVTITLAGTNVSAAGLDRSLAQAITDVTTLDPKISWDGSSTLTVKPGAINPIKFNFYAVPSYTETSDVTVTMTISSPAQGSIQSGAGTASTLVKNVSKPTNPSLLFPTTALTTVGSAASGQNNITVSSTTGLQVLGTLAGTSVPSLTWITAVNGGVLTLSNNLSGTIGDGSSLTYTPPGFWFDFSTSSNVTKDGSNKVSAATDLLNGYQITQATGANQPVWTASSLNSLGGLTLNGSSWLSIAASDHPLVNLLDSLGQHYTIILVAKLTSASQTGFYAGWDALNLRCDVAVSNKAMVGLYTASEDLAPVDVLNNPVTWQIMSDGAQQQVRLNGQRFTVPTTLTAPTLAGSNILTVDDTSGIRSQELLICPGIGISSSIACRATSIDSLTQITLVYGGAHDLPTGATVNFVSRCNGTPGFHLTPAATSGTFSLGNNVGAAFSTYLDWNFGNGSVSGQFPFTGVIYEMIVVPRILSKQEWLGVTLYLANKWGTTTSVNTGATASAGDMKLTMSDVSAIFMGMTIGATTGIAAGTTVIGVNHTSKVIKIDTAVTGTISSGTSLGFNSPSFKRPPFVDITQFYPTFRDDFSTLRLWNGKAGWVPYLGSPGSPGTFSGAYYGAPAFGSSESNYAAWFLDVLNYTPWLKQYDPYAIVRSPGAESGELTITATPAPPAIANLIGYAPPNPNYTYTSGIITSVNWFSQQYGYWEARVKMPSSPGAWPAFWMQSIDGIWPPEIDIVEGDSGSPALVGCTVHSNATLVGLPTFTDSSQANYGSLEYDNSSEYLLYGMEVNAQKINCYVNRELVASYATPFDANTLWYMLLDLAVFQPSGGSGALVDHVTPLVMHTDYVGVWKRNLQSPSIPGTTQAETIALLAAMSVQPSAPRQALINTLIASLQSYTTSFGQTLWDALDFLYLVAAHDSQAGLINWKNPAQIGTLVGTPTFTTDRGYVGVVGTSYIDTGVNMSTSGWQLTNQLMHIGCVAPNGNVGFNVTDTTDGGTTGAYCIIPSSTGFIRSRILNSQTATVLFNFPGGVGGTAHYMVSRNYYKAVGYKNAQILGAAALSGNPMVSPESKNLTIANTNILTSCAHGGNYLSPDDVQYLYSLLYNFLHALGAL